jgi:hypothetical protein
MFSVVLKLGEDILSTYHEICIVTAEKKKKQKRDGI